MIALRFVTLFFPFIRETILGKATIREAVRYAPRKLILLCAVMLSFFLNAIFLPQYITLRKEYNVLSGVLTTTQAQVQNLVDEVKDLKLKRKPPPTDKEDGLDDPYAMGLSEILARERENQKLR